MGLDDGVYGVVCSNILSTEPLPNLNRVYSMIVQEERHKSILRSKDERSEVVGFTTQTGLKAAAVRTKIRGCPIADTVDERVMKPQSVFNLLVTRNGGVIVQKQMDVDKTKAVAVA